MDFQPIVGVFFSECGLNLVTRVSCNYCLMGKIVAWTCYLYVGAKAI